MDVKVNAISKKHNISISIIDLSNAMLEICELQQTNPIASIALSKLTTCNALIGMDLKNHETTTSNLNSENGIIKTIIGECQDNKVRAFISNPQFDVELLKQDNSFDNLLAQAIGDQGTLTVSRTTLRNEPYVSQIDLGNKSIDLDYMDFLKSSNQITSFIASNVELDEELKVKKVVGILIQLLPGHSDDDVEYIVKTLGSSSYVADILNKSTNYTALIEEIADDAIVLETSNVRFECTCNRQKTINTVKLLGEKEVNEIISENKNIDVICDFCKTKYIISPAELKS